MPPRLDLPSLYALPLDQSSWELLLIDFFPLCLSLTCILTRMPTFVQMHSDSGYLVTSKVCHHFLRDNMTSVGNCEQTLSAVIDRLK